MKINLTPQIYTGAGVLFLAALLGLGSLFAGIGSYPVNEEAVLGFALTTNDTKVHQHASVQAPIVTEATGARVRNPFNLKKAVEVRVLRIPMPPAPTLDSPTPPVLPMKKKGL